MMLVPIISAIGLEKAEEIVQLNKETGKAYFRFINGNYCIHSQEDLDRYKGLASVCYKASDLEEAIKQYKSDNEF
ncbi:MAG: hypothetical protein AB1706_02070 [Pseudomonadota bacterium]